MGCGWTQFPVDLATSPVRMLGISLAGDDGDAAEMYENFFVCNYGVGGNVLGQPVFNCEDDNGEEKDDGQLASSSDGLTLPVPSMVLEFRERYPSADEATSPATVPERTSRPWWSRTMRSARRSTRSIWCADRRIVMP